MSIYLIIWDNLHKIKKKKNGINPPLVYFSVAIPLVSKTPPQLCVLNKPKLNQHSLRHNRFAATFFFEENRSNNKKKKSSLKI